MRNFIVTPRTWNTCACGSCMAPATREALLRWLQGQRADWRITDLGMLQINGDFERHPYELFREGHEG